MGEDHPETETSKATDARHDSEAIHETGTSKDTDTISETQAPAATGRGLRSLRWRWCLAAGALGIFLVGFLLPMSAQLDRFGFALRPWWPWFLIAATAALLLALVRGGYRLGRAIERSRSGAGPAPWPRRRIVPRAVEAGLATALVWAFLSGAAEEEYRLGQLRSPDEASRLSATSRLSEMRAYRAIDDLAHLARYQLIEFGMPGILGALAPAGNFTNSSNVRIAAIEALGTFGPAAAGVVTDLEEAALDPNPATSAAAEAALAKIRR